MPPGSRVGGSSAVPERMLAQPRQLRPATTLDQMSAYLLLLAVPLVRNRRHRPLLTLADHLAYGAGVLRELPRTLAAQEVIR